MPPRSENEDSSEVWAEEALQGACTVDILLSSTRRVLKSLPLSVAVLALASPHLRAQALRWAAQSPPPGSKRTRAHRRQKQDEEESSSNNQQAPASAHKVLEILVEDVEKVPVVEVCLRFAYDGAKALGQPGAQGLPQLLAVFKRADYLGMSSCCMAVQEAAAQLKAEEVGLDDAVSVWGSDLLPHSDQLRQVCTRVLLHHLGDVVFVMRGEELCRYFMELPLPGMLALLDSDDLATDSEDSVVAAVGCWVDYDKLSDEECKQVAQRLRLLQLTEVYLHTVVPAMPWLMRQLPLGTFGRLTGAQRAMQRKDERAFNLYKSGSRCESSWFSTAIRRVSVAGTTAVLLDDHLTRQLIVDKLLPLLREADEADSDPPPACLHLATTSPWT